MASVIKDSDWQFLEALKLTFGNVTAACESTGFPRYRHYELMAAYPEYKKAVQDIEEMNLDIAESQLRKSINEGNLKAVTFYLRSKGKDRGYGDLKQIEIKGEKKKLSWFTDEDAQDVL